MAEAESEESVGLDWRAYGARIAVGLVWLAAGAVAAMIVAEPKPWSAVTAAAGLVVCAPAVAWLHGSLRRMRRADEFDRNLIAMAVSSGAAWALVFGPMLIGLNSLLRVASIGRADVPKLGLVLLCTQPAMGMLFGETMAQLARRSYARKAGA